jgi:hypothetical protein
MWHALNPVARDFRLVTNDSPLVINPILWIEQPVANTVRVRRLRLRLCCDQVSLHRAGIRIAVCVPVGVREARDGLACLHD